MISASLVVELGGEPIISMETTFPAVPQVGQMVHFWHGRQQTGGVVDAVFFNQQTDGSFGLVVMATVPQGL